ncbi:hypothetical protein FHR81_000770 [Actinoalloteichus hoggarensis]|uniref:23S rRNA (Guanine(2535)-N(1))-methyltransferase n=1 Tax=Actinoalloteichus hoggarensis TaxID=1470176 RepID=A0A221W1A9_9PSEU|nr:hypothetical protein [Actinoalloteichus hoggarensis]ASO19552.1 23S rRNA (guanine(2535)-N(1))-methyltransferase [Actinoalloteichus hoggarensis]MBB5919741.1 hypothetical protein [Actinoalloteichus hoggarensis]
MSYRFAVERTDHADLAGGAVLRSAPGFPGFPVRLAVELFARARAWLPDRSELTLWDPLCGSGYLLTVLGLLHRHELGAVLASDVDPRACALAAENLGLLGEAGLRARSAHLRDLAERFDKPSHAEAAEAADRLTGLLRAGGGDLPAVVRRADATNPTETRAATAGLPPVDLVITDLPYGEQTAWQGQAGAATAAAPDAAGADTDDPTGPDPNARAAPATPDPVTTLSRALRPALPPSAVVVLVDRSRRVRLPAGPWPLERVRIGTRAAVLLRAADLPG